MEKIELVHFCISDLLIVSPADVSVSLEVDLLRLDDLTVSPVARKPKDEGYVAASVGMAWSTTNSLHLRFRD